MCIDPTDGTERRLSAPAEYFPLTNKQEWQICSLTCPSRLTRRPPAIVRRAPVSVSPKPIAMPGKPRKGLLEDASICRKRVFMACAFDEEELRAPVC